MIRYLILITLLQWSAGLLAQKPGAHCHGVKKQDYRRVQAQYPIPGVNLRDRHDRSITLTHALDHDGPVLLQFIFTTCPTVCPLLTGMLAGATGKVPPTVRMVSITIDPEHDTPAVLARYAAEHNAGPNWRFLTGDAASIKATQQAFDAWRENKMQHIPLTFLRMDPQGPWLRFEGFMSPTELAAEFHKATAP